MWVKRTRQKVSGKAKFFDNSVRCSFTIFEIKKKYVSKKRVALFKVLAIWQNLGLK